MTYREANDLIDQAWAESLHQGEKYSPEQIGAFKGILAVRLSKQITKRPLRRAGESPKIIAERG